MSEGRKTLRTILIILIGLGIVGYSVFQARKIIEGPRIAVSAPQDGAVISEKKIEISGNAKNVAFLYFNGRKIFTDDDGLFKEISLLFPGHNTLEFTAQDKFGHAIKKEIVIYYDGS